jgi:hypothetical protein
MSVNLIFKIAAVGILVSVLSQVLKQSGRGNGIPDRAGRASGSAFLDTSLYQSVV